MSPDISPDAAGGETLQEQPAPACVMSFNASDPSGAGGLAGDVSTIAAMGAHALPVVTTIVMRDTAEVFDQHVIDADVVAEQARSILEDVTISGWKVGVTKSTSDPCQVTPKNRITAALYTYTPWVGAYGIGCGASIGPMARMATSSFTAVFTGSGAVAFAASTSVKRSAKSFGAVRARGRQIQR